MRLLSVSNLNPDLQIFRHVCIYIYICTVYTYICIYIYILLRAGGPVARTTTRWGKLRHHPPDSRNCRPSLRIIPWGGGSFNRPWTPIPPPRSVGSFCLESIYRINHAVSSTEEPHPRYVLPEPFHSSNYQLPFRFGCSRAELPRTYRLGWTDYRV